MRGSEWNKWNIHVHTKGTNKNDQFASATTDDFFAIFFKKALAQNISAIAITDYFSIDNYKTAIDYVGSIDSKIDSNNLAIFTKEESDRIKSIFLLPNVELRMMPSTDAGKLINIHCLFNPEYVHELDNDFFNTMQNQDGKMMNRAGIISYGKSLLSGLPTDEQCYKEGVDRFVVDIKSLKNILDSNAAFRNNTIVIVSNSSKDGNSALQKHYDLFEGEPGALDGVRKTIYKISNAVFSPNSKDVSYFLGKRLDNRQDVTEEEKAEERKLVLRERGSFKACLVGCDSHQEDQLFTRFTWIKSALDFNGFRQIMFEPEQRVKIQNHEPDLKEEKLVIDHVRYVSNDNMFTPEPIYLNRNLNVIIGGKSSGKSILLYNIAKTLLPDRSILKTVEKEGGYKYSFPAGFDFEVTIGTGHSQSIKRADDIPSILPEIKYIPQNYLSKLAEPENKKGNELVKLVRGLLLEDSACAELYEGFLSRLRSNDRKREIAINSYFELKDKIRAQRTDMIQRGDVDVLKGSIKANQEKIGKLKESAGLDEKEIEAYNKLSVENAEIEGEVNKIRNDYTKVNSLNTDIRTVLTDVIQKKDLALNALEDSLIHSHYEKEYQIIDEALLRVNKIDESIALNETNHFKNENIFTQQAHPLTARLKEVKSLLAPFVQNQLIKTEIESLEKVVNDDMQKLAGISQIVSEIAKNEIGLQTEKNKLFDNYKENYNEYIKIISDLNVRTRLLESDRLQILGTPKFNFPKFRTQILPLMDGRKANFSAYSMLEDKRTGTTSYTIDEVMHQLIAFFDSMIERRDFPFVSKADEKTAIKALLEDYFFDYWDVVYDHDKLEEMSTGKASFVILMLIVGLSKSKAPILIDQPEDNLDNRSITKDLIEYLRNKKLERQIILVTHNANVVVNADAENVIVANQKGQNDKITTSPYQFDYINGPIERTKPLSGEIPTDLLKSMGIREHIADIVEGGEEAFKKREKKYGFSK